jgi:hypothetical protein
MHLRRRAAAELIADLGLPFPIGRGAVTDGLRALAEARGRTMADGRGGRILLAAPLLLVLVAAGCSTTNGSPQAQVIRAGQVNVHQVNVQLPPGYRAAPTRGVHAVKSGGGGGTATTVPLAQQNPTTAFFTAIGVFQGCLKSLGVSFIGAPNAKDPNSPANNPTYLKNLETCATKSGIVQALKAEQASQNNLTPAQIAKENKQYLKWRTCMIGKGWTIPVPQPNAQGELFSFSGSGGAQMTPPAGQSLFNSPDISACSAQVQRESGGSSE